MPHDRLRYLPALSHVCLSYLESGCVQEGFSTIYMMRMDLTLLGIEQASTWFLA
jgi:hypothetical protein